MAESKLTEATISADDTHAQEELRKFQAVADYLPHLAWSCRYDGYCDYLSRRWVEYTGLPAETHYGRGWLAAVHPHDRTTVRQTWDSFIQGVNDYDVDYRLRRHDGQYRWFKTRGVLLRAGDGRATLHGLEGHRRHDARRGYRPPVRR